MAYGIRRKLQQVCFKKGFTHYHPANATRRHLFWEGEYSWPAPLSHVKGELMLMPHKTPNGLVYCLVFMLPPSLRVPQVLKE